MPVHEGPRIALGFQELTNGYAFIKILGLRLSGPEETDNIPQHAPMPGYNEVAGVSHHLQKRVARVLAGPAVE